MKDVKQIDVGVLNVAFAAVARDAVDLLNALGIQHAKIAGFDWGARTRASSLCSGPSAAGHSCR